MAKTITLREANNSFASGVRDVESGQEYVITRNGVAIARLVPAVPGRQQMSPSREERQHRRIDRRDRRENHPLSPRREERAQHLRRLGLPHAAQHLGPVMAG